MIEVYKTLRIIGRKLFSSEEVSKIEGVGLR